MMMQNIHKILVIAPHTDDGELGAGGSIAKFIESGAEVHYCAFSIAEEAIPSHLPKDILASESRQATKRLGILPEHVTLNRFSVRRFREHRQDILDIMVKLSKQENFDLVMIPSLQDIHQDHQVVAEEAVRAFKKTSILSYELPWNNLTFSHDCFVHLTESHLQKKIDALEAYSSQKERKYMAKDFIEGLAKIRGLQANNHLAEVFEVVRWIIK